jgi:hypothetical protein
MGSNHPEIQAAVARVRWQRARGLPDHKPKRPGPRVVHQLSVAKEEKLVAATKRAFEVMREAWRLAQLAPQLPNPPRDEVLARVHKASKLILAGLHEAGLDPPRLPSLSRLNGKEARR